MSITILERARGVFRLRIETGKDETGKRLFTYETVRGTKKDAEARKAELTIAGRNSAAIGAAGSITVGEYMDRWLRRVVGLKTVGDGSADNYRWVVETTKRHLGAVKLRDLTRQQAEEAFAAMMTTKQTATSRRPLSAGTVSHLSRRVQHILDMAVEEGLIAVNPLTKALKPKKTPPKIETLFDDDIRLVLAKLENNALGPVLRFALATGCRRGELCALKWSDLDFTAGVARIRRIVVKPKKAPEYEKEPKTASSIRTVRLPVTVIEELKAAYEVRASDYVFPAQGTRRRSLDALTAQVSAFLKGCGLGRFTLHDLRHAHATYLLRRRENVTAVSKRMGHSDVRTTLLVYSKSLPTDDAALSEQAGTMFGT